MDAKQAIELLRHQKIYGVAKLPADVTDEIADLIESLAAKAELGEVALKAAEGLDCKRVDDNQCDRGDRYLWPSCNFRDFCRLRAGREKSIVID